MRFKNLDLIGAIFFAGLNMGLIQVPNHPLIVGVILAIPLIFILPGYTLTQILFSKQSPDSPDDLILRPSLKIEQPISTIDWLAFSLGLSLAIDVVTGFALNILPIGLQGLSWTLSLGLITTVFALLAALLRRKDSVRVGRRLKRSIPIYNFVLFGLAILIAAAAVWYSILRPPDPQRSFTQFWMLPSQQANNSCGVVIGIHSYEAVFVTYRLVMKINGIQETPDTSISLAPQQEWSQLVSFKSDASGTMYIEADLYRADKPEIVYHKVHVTFNASRGNKDQKMQC